MTRAWILIFLLSVNAFAQTASKVVPPDPPKETGDVAITGASQPKLMDGVELEAVETYINPTQNQLGLGIGLYPFDAYFYGLSISAGYTYHSSRTIAWEVINAQYFFSFQKDLTSELAEVYGVSPKVITTLDYIISTDIQYVFAYGKLAMMEEYIRYFRASAMGGAAGIKTSDKTQIALLGGLKFEAFTKGSFSWTFEIRDTLAFPSLNNFVTFTLGTGISF